MSQNITTTSRVTMEFAIDWQEGGIRHQDCLTANQVNFWRDILDPGFLRQITGKMAGEKAELTIRAAEFLQPYSEKKRQQIRAEQFVQADPYGNPVVLREGRFYPQMLLRGVDGVFGRSVLPFRLLSIEDEHLTIDLNHPLAGRDLTFSGRVIAIHPEGRERGGRCEHWLERLCTDGPGMQVGGHMNLNDWLSPGSMERADSRPDEIFYRQPRLVHHLDEAARKRLTASYGRLIAPGSRVLDLMASWHSHLPETLELDELTVLGMNDDELRQNHRATSRLVFDLNGNKPLPFDDASYDAVTISASIEYLTDPLHTLYEVARILRPGGILAIGFSNRWFPPKAIRVWTELHEFERLGLVTAMVSTTKAFSRIQTSSHRTEVQPFFGAPGETTAGNPLYMVWAWRGERNEL